MLESWLLIENERTRFPTQIRTQSHESSLEQYVILTLLEMATKRRVANADQEKAGNKLVTQMTDIGKICEAIDHCGAPL